MIGLIWSIFVTGLILYGASQALPSVRCKDPAAAFQVAGIFGIANWILFSVLFKLGALTWLFTVVITAIIPPLAAMAALSVVFLPMLVSIPSAFLSLYVADQMIEDFEIQGAGTTFGISLAIGVASVLFNLF